jgi:hypothetical protein
MTGTSIHRIVMLAAFVTLPTAVGAQEIPSPLAAAVAEQPMPVVTPAQATVTGPVLVQAGVTRAAVAVDAELHLQNRGRGNRNVRWMWVGGGLILAGAVVGDDVGTILTIGGLVIGLTGLYRYMQ